MRPDIQIATMLKALADVVIPAIPEENRLAVEQARLIAGMLTLMQFQLPRQFRFDCDELQRLRTVTDDLIAMPTADRAIAEAIETLQSPSHRARDVLARCQGDPSEPYTVILALRSALCDLVDAAADSADHASRDRIEASIRAMSAQQLQRDRALMKLQSWEPDPAALPDIDTLLAS